MRNSQPDPRERWRHAPEAAPERARLPEAALERARLPEAAPERARLFTPGPRLGWVFRDRRELAVPYPEPEPDRQAIQARTAGRAQAAERAFARAWKWIGRPSIAAALILVAMAGCAKAVSGSYTVMATGAFIGLLCLPGLAYTGWCWLRRGKARQAGPEQEYRAALAAWDEHAARHEAAEEARLAGQPEWRSLSAPARRVDVFGGSLTGWQGLLTVHGASLLAQRPVLVADLTGQYASRGLVIAARAASVSCTTYRLPHDLGRSGLLTELPPTQLANAIAEAIHAGAAGGSSASAGRPERAIDVRVLQQLATALASRGVTPRRLAAAVRAALGSTGRAGNPVPGGALTPDEEELIAGDLFPAGYREQVIASLVRLDAVLSDLAAYAADGWAARPARLTVLAMDPAARSASGEVLTGLLVQWLTVQVSARPARAAAAPVPAVLIAGADEVTRAHAERLGDACEVRGVPLTLMFRHLRDDSASLLGGGSAAFMRLANHAEAERAAGYIGRRHTFVMSSFTVTRGRSLTTTRGTSHSYGSGENTSTARARGWSGSPAGGALSAGTRSGGWTQATGTSTSRTSGTNWSAADGASWSDAQARQRVYEFAVEPTVLQNLPDHAMLLADRTGQALRLRAVECDPDIITLPGAAAGPLSPPGNIPPGGTYRHVPDGVAGYGEPPYPAMAPGGPPALPEPAPPVIAAQYAGTRYDRSDSGSGDARAAPADPARSGEYRQPSNAPPLRRRRTSPPEEQH